jgi:hypothetical protein
MNFMAVSSSSLGLALHFNPKRGGTKAQQTVICAMKLAKKPSFFLWLAQKAIWGQKSTKKRIQEIKSRFIEPPRVFWRAKP